MKISANDFKYLWVLAGLLIAHGVHATEINLLNLANKNENDTSLGDRVIVKLDASSGEKYLTGNNSDGQLLATVNLPMESEVNMRFYLASISYDLKLFLLADEYQIKLKLNPMGRSYNQLSGNALTASTDDASGAWENGYNKVRLVLTDGEAKVYINDVFSQKATLSDPNLVFTQLKVNSIDPLHSNGSIKTAIYEIKAGGNVTTACSINSSTPTNVNTNGNNSTGSTTAIIGSNLNIHIPNASYHTLLDTMNLWVDLQLVPSTDDSLMWRLSNYGVIQ